MRNLTLLLILALMFLFNDANAQTAVNFTVNDCSGTSHTLFDELDAGKVVVISWVMPCGACTGPALSAYSEAKNYASTNPDRIKYYLVDDYANTSCTSLTTWATNSGISAPDAVFSSRDISMNDYGGAGMPKIVVVGQNSHTVFYNQNNSFNVTKFKAAIENALGAITAVPNSKNISHAVIYPNPIQNDVAIIDLNLTSSADVEVQIYDVFGNSVLAVQNEKNILGNHQIEINTSSLINGIYFATVKSNQFTNTLKFSVAK